MWVFLWAGFLGHCLLEWHPDPNIMNCCCEVEREREDQLSFLGRGFSLVFVNFFTDWVFLRSPHLPQQSMKAQEISNGVFNY